MEQPLLAYNVWIALPTETRIKLRTLFDIPRTGEVIIRSGGMINGNIGGVLQQDGHSAGDLYAITVEKMQKLLNTDDVDFYKMFNHIVENIDYVMSPKEEVIIEGKGVVVTVEEKQNFAELMTEKPTPKKRGRKPKHAQE